MTNFHGDQAEKIFFFEKKKSKRPTQKKVIFQNRQFSIFFCENLLDWSLGRSRALMWLNLYGHEAVRHNNNYVIMSSPSKQNSMSTAKRQNIARQKKSLKHTRIHHKWSIWSSWTGHVLPTIFPRDLIDNPVLDIVLIG